MMSAAQRRQVEVERERMERPMSPETARLAVSLLPERLNSVSPQTRKERVLALATQPLDLIRAVSYYALMRIVALLNRNNALLARAASPA